MYLDALLKGDQAVIKEVETRSEADAVAQRLGELGFIPGAVVEILAVGPVGHDPIAVRCGTARFALRRNEASRINLVEPA